MSLKTGIQFIDIDDREHIVIALPRLAEPSVWVGTSKKGNPLKIANDFEKMYRFQCIDSEGRIISVDCQASRFLPID